jgi:small subunit ribosomal protein S16
MGAKKRPYYRIVAADSRRARDGRFLETLGTYHPITKPAEVTVAEDKLIKWLDQGATPSDTVSSLLTQIGFTEKYLKAKRGEDVSEIALKTVITERKKKTRKMKKAAVAAAKEESAKEEAPPQEKAPTETPAEESPDKDASQAPADESNT